MLARPLLALLALSLFAGCSAEYHARRQARYEERLALREQHRQQRLAQQQQRMYARCSNTQWAYERGHNDGIGRDDMDTRWIARCPAELQQQQYQAYNQGYQEGVQHAPQVEVRYRAQPQPRGAAIIVVGQPAVTSCTFSSDCGDSMSCRNWGGAGQVCMGYGGSGAPCWFGSDCVSGWCDGGTTGAQTCR